MITCDAMSDRLPALARGEVEWLPEEREHLQRCPECRREWEVVHAGATLGIPAGERIDPAAVAGTVATRLRARPRHSYRVVWLFGSAAAAAAAIVVTAVTVREPAAPEPARQTVASTEPGLPLIPLPLVASLDTTELNEALNAIEGPLPEVSDSTGLRVEDLTVQQMEQLLHSLEVS